MLTGVGGLQDAQTSAGRFGETPHVGCDPSPSSQRDALQQTRHLLRPEEQLLVGSLILVVSFQSKGLSTLWEETLI